MVSRPNQPFPFTAATSKPATPKIIPDPTLDTNAYEQLIRNRGVRFRVYHRMPCPNVNNIEENHHNPDCQLCSNGFFYYDRGIAIGVFTSNSLKNTLAVDGQWQIGTAAVTIFAYSDDSKGNIGLGEPVCVDNFDKLILVDYQFKHSELIEHNFATKIDRLRYPVIEVDKLLTKNREYKHGIDFVITADGDISWTGRDHPTGTTDVTDSGETYGEIYSVSYFARPVYYVTSIVHDLRATTGWNDQLNRKEAVKLPQQVIITRDYLIDHPGDKQGERFARAPRSGASIVAN